MAVEHDGAESSRIIGEEVCSEGIHSGEGPEK